MNGKNIVTEKTKMGKKKIGDYILNKELGRGKYGIVYLAVHNKTRKFYAAKQLSKPALDSDPHLKRLFHTEITIMNEINHPNILHLFDYLESENNYYLIVNYCNRGSLGELMRKQKNRRFEEKEAIGLLKQIINAFIELRKHKVLHRDLKLDNIFMKDDRVVIGDFGFAKMGEDFAISKLGTPLTMAYELLTAKESETYNSKADMWSIGVIYYQMLYGNPPFSGMSIEDLIANIEKNANYNLKFPYVISKGSKDLINRILVTDPGERLNWFELFSHDLFKTQVNKKSGFIGEVEHQTAKEFNKNLQESGMLSNIKLLDREALIKNYENRTIIAKKVVTETMKTSIENRDGLEEFRGRVNNEKKLLLFYRNTISKLKHCVEFKHFPNFTNTFYNLMGLLLKKIEVVSKFLLKELQSELENFVFREKDVEEVKKSKDHIKFINYLKIKIEKTKRKIDLLIEEASEKEVMIKNKKDILSSYLSLKDVDGLIDVSYQKMKKFKETDTKLPIEEKRFFAFVEMLVKCSLKSDKVFQFRDYNNPKNRKFDWRKFYTRVQNVRNQYN